jgi:hypothetical protein
MPQQTSAVIVSVKASGTIAAFQAVRYHGPETVAAATDGNLFRNTLYDGVALTAATDGQKLEIVVLGQLMGMALAPDPACAVGVDSTGQLVRATNSNCVSAPNWVGYCDTNGNITIAPRRVPHFDPLDFGATGDGKTDDSPAFAAMFAAMPGFGTVKIPLPVDCSNSRATFSLTSQYGIEGPGKIAPCLKFAQEGKGIRLRSGTQSGAGPGAQGTAITDLNLVGTHTHFDEWQPNHDYKANDRIRCKRGSLSVLNDTNQEDPGIHFLCIQPGQSGSNQPIWDDDNALPALIGSFCRKSQDSRVDPAFFEFSTGLIFALCMCDL